MTSILVTGAAGAVGRAFLEVLAEKELPGPVTATDLHRPIGLPDGIDFVELDVRDDEPDRVIGKVKPDVVVHLASIVTPPKGASPELAYDVDVNGTQNILSACRRHNVRRLVVTSSGAAYGYHEDNSVPLRENDPIRGNEEFPYSHHKRLVEEMLAKARKTTPKLEQVILRVGTVLGDRIENQITDLFQQPKVVAVQGSDSPFVFIWTNDLARILLRAATDGPPGIYNVAGDGAVDVNELGRIMGKPVTRIPAWVLKMVLRVVRVVGLSQYGPEQVRFLQYRPVLDNTRLKTEFGYTPQKTSAEVFADWWDAARP